MAENGLPEGWYETSLGMCVDVLDNLRIPVNSDDRKRRPGNIPYFGATQQVGWIDDYIFDEELVLLGEDGAPFLDKSKSIAYIIEGKSWVNNHAHVLRAIAGLSSNHYVKHLLNATDFAQFVGGTTRLKLNQGKMRLIPVALPPFAEQKRIVAMVEMLLERVNAARDRLSNVPTIIKRFRQSVLAAACSGRLTADWRDAHPDIEPAAELLHRAIESRRTHVTSRRFREPVSPESVSSTPLPENWMWVSLDQTSQSIQDGNYGEQHPKPADYRNEGIPFLTAANIDKNGNLDPATFKFIDVEQHLRLTKAQARCGDLIFPNRGASDGQLWGTEPFVAIVPDSIPEANVNPQLTRIRVDDCVLNSYLRHAMCSDSFLSQFRSLGTGSALRFVGLTKSRSIGVPLAPLDEQHEIVRRVEALFKTADAIEGRVAAGTQRADNLTQSILAKAFRGELVPTEAELARQEGRSYEPASVLLERIKAEREAAEATKPKRKPRRGSRSPKPTPKELDDDGGQRNTNVGMVGKRGDPRTPRDDQIVQPERDTAGRDDDSPDLGDIRTDGRDGHRHRRANRTGLQNGKRRPIDDYETDEVMAAFRQVYQGRAKMPEDDLLRETARRFGFGRLGSSIKDRLKGHLRAAIRRKILVRKRDIIELETFRMDEFTRDELVDVLESVMAKGRWYERDEVIEAAAHYLGFTRLRESVIDPIKSAINSAIRRDFIEYDGSAIWRT